jgi:peptidoglycan glycosyltransferase
VIGFSLFGAGAYFAWRSFTHVQTRVNIWLDPWKNPAGDGYQIIQSLFAMAFGGVTGTGLGLGGGVRIPASENDFIFAVIAEELGLAGGALVLMAYLLMVGSGLRIATRADHAFDKLLATGLTLLLGLQAFIIVAGVLRVLPLTGVTLPFVSYGGSSLVVNYVLLALLLRISDQSERARKPLPMSTVAA